MSQQRWMLPEGVEESLAPNAWALEDLRRTLLDHYRQRGYDLILPPLIEHLDALLTGSAQDLEEQTFKLTDPVSGRPIVLPIGRHHVRPHLASGTGPGSGPEAGTELRVGAAAGS